MIKQQITRQVTLRAVYPAKKGKDVMENKQLMRKIAADIGDCLMREHMIKVEVVTGEDYDEVHASVKIVTEPG